jgi:hypothetical protein
VRIAAFESLPDGATFRLTSNCGASLLLHGSSVQMGKGPLSRSANFGLEVLEVIANEFDGPPSATEGVSQTRLLPSMTHDLLAGWPERLAIPAAGP